MQLCGSGALLTGTDPEESQKQLKKQQKNRLAAQRSRQKHTDKADALHQHESLEKHNHALRKEIQALKAELAQWGQTLHMHERLCGVDCASCPALLPSGCPGQVKQLSGQPAPHGCHGCQQQLGLFQTPGSSPRAQQLSPGPHYHESPGLLPSPVPSLSLDPLMVRTSIAQLSPSPVLSASTSGSSVLESFSRLDSLPPSPADQLVPPQPLRLEQPTSTRLEPSNSPVALGSECQQNSERLPALSDSSAHWQKLPAASSPHVLTAFPLLSSAKVRF
ncbi:basic leucine zipper transcriptional factor ATF-like 2 isoform X2 [Acomys russatus]|uniref:basic leucine zipper transcriptional factor ATF-like 2 isoform X2 n=1 Tax=Acomys russatus TaxID=60746 RepID=UPI0021E242F2|nr:basic leucine zipper transcriptional factor ATF-like 2 isoform X2 [Acomys russatus]